MALNIPVNLMSTAAPLSQSPTAVGAETTVTAIQPAGSSADTRDTAAGNGGNSGQAQQQALFSKRMLSKAASSLPDRAEPTSVVTAQVAPKAANAGQKPADPAPQVTSTRPSEIDRYAPPDPLPTAPILQAAASYAARNDPL